MNVARWSLCIALCAFVPLAAAQMTPTRRTTSDGRPLASSLPPKPGSSYAQPQPLAFPDLARHVDARIIITTIYGVKHEGRVDGVSGSTLRLKSSAGLGYAVTNFERDKIRSITLLP
jgi:hypothetical protein